MGGGLVGNAVVSRYDTQAPLADATSWSAFDIATHEKLAAAPGFVGTVFDGAYIYFIPFGTSVMARFHAKAPASMPSLPAFYGSFF